MPADIILYALIAAGLVLWLRSLLGMRQDGERQRPNPFAEAESQHGAKPHQLPPPALAGEQNAGLLPEGVDAPVRLDRGMAVSDQAQSGLKDIMRNDRTFDVAHFLTGAQDAFVMIVEAFANSDRDTLRGLLDKRVLQLFETALESRAKTGEQASVEIHAVRRAEIVNAWMDGRTALVTVRFVADETNVLHDREGKLLSGHPDKVTETIDIWTFSRDTKSRDPSWLLAETREEQADDSAHPVVPGADHKVH